MKDAKPKAAEIDILYPERSVTIAGETIIVRELAFGETLRLEPAMAPLLRAFIDLPVDDADDPITGQFAQMFGAHAHAWTGFMATACDKPREWVEGLSDDDGRLLSMTVWTVNASFFTRRVISGMIARRSVSNAQSITANSTPN